MRNFRWDDDRGVGACVDHRLSMKVIVQTALDHAELGPDIWSKPMVLPQRSGDCLLGEDGRASVWLQGDLGPQGLEIWALCSKQGGRQTRGNSCRPLLDL